MSSTGTYTVDVNVTWTSSVVFAVANGSCAAATVSGSSYTYSYCVAAGEWELFLDAWMVDATNGTYYYGSDRKSVV